jgi:cell division protein FtsB
MEKKKNKFNSIKRRKKIHIWTKKERNQWRPRGLFFIKLLLYLLFFLTKIYIVVVFYYINK